jgi:N-acetylmuramoyl-L-alanine amidase
MIAKPPSPDKAGGLLLAAFRAGKTDPITWVDIPCEGLIITVANDAMKATVRGEPGVRLPVTYTEQVELCREMNCISPTKEMADAMFAHGVKLNFVPLVQRAEDSKKMMTLDFTMRFHQGIEKQIAVAKAAPGQLVFGAWKLWILHQRIIECGAINYGFWDKSRKPPSPIQTVGGRHDAAHYDYSQVFQPVKRMAKNAKTGAPVDLVDYLAHKFKVAERYIEPYRFPPGVTIENFADAPPPRNLVEALLAAGIEVQADPGWEKAGRPNFTPMGIMLHHTAGPAGGDAPTLNVCRKGRPDLPGPLCQIVLGRSGKAYVLAAGRTNHAGDGAQQVLDKVKKDQPVIGNAITNKYKDVKGLSGNGYFYGIEVENTGRGEAYPGAQIEALAKICAAICTWRKWSANRVIHHRQWTMRKMDMSYKGDMPSMVAQMMDAGVLSFGESFCEEEEAPFPPELENASPQEEYDEP